MNQRKLASAWNEKYGIGQKVKVEMDDGTFIETETTNGATLLGGHTAVGWFKDIRGCYALERAQAI